MLDTDQHDWSSDYREALACDHSSREIRRKKVASGAWWYWSQCLRCGAIERVKTADVPRGLTPPLVDDNLRESFSRRQIADIQRRQIEVDAAKQQEWWSWYSDYLQSPQWRALRRKVLARDKGRCQGCLEADATQVHHLTYDRVGNEMLFDLVAMCKNCHHFVTTHSRDRRDEYFPGRRD